MTTNSQALERARPQDRALVQAASELGIPIWESGGVRGIDLSGPELAERFNVLAPAATLIQANPNFTPGIAAVRIDPDPDGQEVYPIEKERDGKPKALALTKVGLQKLGDKAGVEHLPPDIQYHGKDLTVTAAIRLRKPDGTFRVLYGSQNWIHDDEYEEVVSQCPEKWGRGDNAHVLTAKEREDWIKKRWAQVKKFNLRMTESKALNAAYRGGALPGLRQKYLPKELQKPFLVTESTFTPDPNDPRVLAMLLRQGQQAENLIYGPALPPAGDADDAIDGHCSEENGRAQLPAAPAGVDPETGEMFPAEQAEGHGERPTEDPTVPQGTYAGKPVSEAIRDDREWGKTMAASRSTTWGPIAEAWLKYWYGEEGDDEIPF